MSLKNQGIKRRDFLKGGALAGLGALLGNSIIRTSYAASKERLTILSSISLDTLHPYAYSSSPQYGIWNHMIEPLVEVDYAKKVYYGVLAESWEFQGKKWIFKLRKNVRFHDGSPLAAKDVIYSISRIKNDKQSLQKDNFRDLTEMQALDDNTIVFTTEFPTRSFSIDCRTVTFSAKRGWKRRVASRPSKNRLGPGRIDSSAGSATAIWC
jgi:ABC-type transport system substrate-binding protein